MELPVFYALGSRKSTTENPYSLGHGVEHKGGYHRFYTTKLVPNIRDGYRRFVLHRPYGETQSGPMNLDQRVELIDSDRFRHVVSDFRSMIELAQIQHPEVVFDIYLGTIEDQLEARLTGNDFFAWMNRLTLSVGDAMELTNCNLMLDASTGVLYENQPEYQYWARMLRSWKERQGRKIFVEALPRRGSWCEDFDAVCIERFYENVRD
ncbi:MAG: hypothetical protein AAGB34_01845, partial [Planctomycetota bacterium]